MNSARSWTVVAVLTFASIAARVALADALPLQDCEGMNPGDPCMNAGSTADQNGICRSTKCTSVDYNCEAGVSAPCGTTTMTCMQCELPDAGGGSGSGSASGSGSGSGGTHGGASGGSGSGEPGGEKPPPLSCAAARVGAGSTVGALFLSLVMVAMTLGLRRRPR